MKSLCCFVVCLSLAGMTASGNLPSYVQTCKVTDPAYDACLIQSVEALRPRLVKGIPAMRIPPFEPFSLPRLELNRVLDPVSVRMVLKDCKGFGASQFQIESLKCDPIGVSMSATVVMPRFDIEGQYDIDGRLLTTVLRGRGNMRVNCTNIRTETTVLTKVHTVDGVKRLSVTNVRTKIRLLGSTDLKLVNRPEDPHNQVATHAANNFFDQNKQQLLAIIYPIIDETFAEIMYQFTESILKHLDYDELFPSQ